MIRKSLQELAVELDGHKIDFYLEDDMFEIEGKAHKEGDGIVVQVENAVGHVLKISGDFLELQIADRCLYAKRRDTKKVFEMEINRIYDQLVDPVAEDFQRMYENGVKQFFKKETDTLVWWDPEKENWTIELNKINMYFSGDRTSFDTLDQLFKANQVHMAGIWQAVHFSSEVEEDQWEN